MDTRAVVLLPPVWGLLGCYFLCGWALGGPRPLRSLPSQAPPGSGPVWLPPEGAEAALAFLHSGDARQLLGANCSDRYEAGGAGASPGLPQVLHHAASTLAQAANFLNMLLQANDIRESSVEEDVEWYQALVRSVAEGDPRAYRASLTFNPPPGASHLQLALQATKMGEETVLKDLSGYRVQKSPAGDPDTPALQKRVLTNDLGSLGSPKWPQGDGYVGDIQQVKLSPPFLECQEGRLRPGWLITLSATFYGLKPDLSPEARGQVQMDIDLQRVDIDQCASSPGWYSNTHLCDLNSTQCVPLENQGFVLGRYLCRCRPGFYGASHAKGLEETATYPAGQFQSPEKLLRCQPCPEGCTSCIDATPCLAEEALALRAAVLACQACCMLAVFLSMLISYRCRWSKRIRASGVVLLETILFGSLLLYFPVFILYFKASVFRCIALRWVRLLGFVIVYGTIILKLYRVLQLFLSRTAQRGPHLSSGRLLRRLGLLLLLVLGFLAVWTAGVLERGPQQTPLVTRGHTPTGRHFYLCHHDRWDYIMVVAELLLLCWGSFLCYATRAVPSAFHEPRYMGIALHNELLLSAAFHTARFLLVPSLHPDWTLLLFFFHTHSTVTATLALIFIPKFRKPGAPPREEILEEVYEDELDLQRSGSYLDSSIASAWSERSLDPGDIRDELKKLYAQLEVHKTREMAANNPHLPKKRGSSRQGLGRSFIRYLAEFPEALARQHSRDSSSPGLSSLPGSSRRRLLSSSLQEPEGPPALRKSRSIYDQHREQEPPLLDSLPRRNLSKKDPRLESRKHGPPALSFRSASAHNLTVGERLPRARPPSLQKSLSVAAGSREKALLMASQAYLEETYRQAKEREERKKAEAAMVSPVRRPSARRLERARGAPVSAPPSPAKSSSVDSSYASGKLHEEAGRRLPHPPIRHQVSTPILALSGACLGEPRMLSPTSTLAPALMPTLAPPALAPVPTPPQSPSLLTFICPWENAELPVKKENVAPEAPLGPEQGSHSPAPARARLWRALSVAVENRGAGENNRDTEGGPLQGEADDADGDRPKIFSKSHSLKTPVQQGSMRSLGLAIKALTRSRSTYKKEGGEGSPEKKGRASGQGVGAAPRSPRSPRPGRPRTVSKQAALAPCDDEESLQNQQNAHTSRMLQVCRPESSREQEDGGKRTAQGLGERRVDRAGKKGPAILRQVFGDKNAEQAREAPVGWQEPPKAGLGLLGSADCRAAEVCPWEATGSETSQLDSSSKAQICPWEVSEGGPDGRAGRQDLNDHQEERRTAPEKTEPKVVAATAWKKPERLVRGQEAVCPRDSADPGGLSPQSSLVEADGTKGRPEAAGGMQARKLGERNRGEAAGPEGCTADLAKAERCPWEVSEEGEVGTPAQGVVKEFPQERQESPKKAAFGDLEAFCPWESTDFRGPLAVSLQASGSPEGSWSPGRSMADVQPREAGDSPAIRKAEACPWELGDELMGTGRDSLQEKGKGSLGEAGDQTVNTGQTSSPRQESPCPWDSAAAGHPGPGAESSSPTAGGQLQSSEGSRVTHVCPWEDLKPEGKEATPAKAEICPWEVKEITEDWTLGQGPRGESLKDEQKVPRKAGIKDARAWEKSEGLMEKQEAVCPWDSVDPSSCPTQPGPQDAERAQAVFQMPGSVEGKAAEICPWDLEETLAAEKAKICPWEVGATAGEEGAQGIEAIRKPPSDTGKPPADSGPRERAVTAPKKPERPALEREVACPWEGLGLGGSCQHSDSLDTDRPKAAFQGPARVGCRPPEVCPWEVEEAPTSEKAEICPWEVNEGGTVEGLGSGSTAQREKTPETGRLTSLGEEVSKPEAKLSQMQEAICPWEDKNLREPSAQADTSDTCSHRSSQVAEGHSLDVSDEATEKGGLRQDPKTDSLREDTTQSEALTTDDGERMSSALQSVSFPPPDSPDQPGGSPQTLASARGRAAEICPWDAPELDACNPDMGAKTEICPWEGAERLPKKNASRQDGQGDSQEKGKAPEKPGPKGVAVQKKPEMADSGKQEAVLPRESPDCRGLSPWPGLRAADRGTGGSEAAGSVGGRAAEVCPWEAEVPPSAKRAEICPWEAREGAAKEGGLGQEVDRESHGRGALSLQEVESEGHSSKAAAELGREQEAVCPWEGMQAGGLLPQPEALDPAQVQVSPHAASGARSRMAELCQWEVTDPEGNVTKGTMADICPWEETGLLALTATQTEAVPAVAETSLCLSVHRPLHSFLPESKSPRPQVRKPASASTVDGVKEPQGPAGLGPRTSSVLEPRHQETEAQQSASKTEDEEQVAWEADSGDLAPANVYPWDWE